MQPRKAAAGGLVSKMKLKTIKKRIVIYLVNHTLAGTRFFSEKRNLLRSIGYEIGENTKIDARDNGLMSVYVSALFFAFK